LRVKTKRTLSKSPTEETDAAAKARKGCGGDTSVKAA
jgi:hypothetical protein